MAPKVVILGGGVAGMSAAHHLIERRFDVEVYEQLTVPGGKARSTTVPGTGDSRAADGTRRLGLPGEHGFRFFPRFYRHIMDTMKRIPVGNDGRRVYHNLVEASRHMLALPGKEPFVFPVRFPRSWDDIRLFLQAALRYEELELTQDDLEWFGWRVWQLMTTCKERLDGEYERIGWWDYLRAEDRSKAFKNLLAAGLTRTLVAAQPHTASTQVGGRILVELLFAMAMPGASADHLLNAPTNEAWLDPWLAYLVGEGVRFHFGKAVNAIGCDGRFITGITLEDTASHERAEIPVTPDCHVLAAMPVEAMAKLLSAELIKADETLLGLRELARQVGWMSGVQYYLNAPTPLAHGHITYIDSPWALTSISQGQFWTGTDLARYGDGTVKDILSVDVSNWYEPGTTLPKRAAECTNAHEIITEVWEQLKQSVNTAGLRLLPDRCPPAYLDPDVVFTPRGARNRTPLLVNQSDSWHLRPDAHTRIPNLFLASDYVRTNTSLATMEAANEAARRAVNAIINASPGMGADYCDIWDFSSPLLLRPLRWHDAKRYALGLPYRERQPFWLRILRWVLKTLFRWITKSARWVARRPALRRHLERP